MAENHQENSFLECSICKELYGETNKPTTLLCGHTFCISCALKLRNKECPVCRQAFTSQNFLPNIEHLGYIHSYKLQEELGNQFKAIILRDVDILDALGSYKASLLSLNYHVRQANDKLGPFDYSKYKDDSVENVMMNSVQAKDKTVYTGEWNHISQKNGKGIQIWPNGQIYEGFWKCDLPNGYGRMIYDDFTLFEGDWKTGKRDGEGRLVNPDESSYEGEWGNDDISGYGVYSYADGSHYDGSWLH